MIYKDARFAGDVYSARIAVTPRTAAIPDRSQRQGYNRKDHPPGSPTRASRPNPASHKSSESDSGWQDPAGPGAAQELPHVRMAVRGRPDPGRGRPVSPRLGHLRI